MGQPQYLELQTVRHRIIVVLTEKDDIYLADRIENLLEGGGPSLSIEDRVAILRRCSGDKNENKQKRRDYPHTVSPE